MSDDEYNDDFDTNYNEEFEQEEKILVDTDSNKEGNLHIYNNNSKEAVEQTKTEIPPTRIIDEKRRNEFKAKQEYARKRLSGIKNKIKLTAESYDLFTLVPLSKYDIFSRSMGKENGISNASTQYNSDWVNKNFQTEDVRLVDAGTSCNEIDKSSNLNTFIGKYSSIMEGLVLENVSISTSKTLKDSSLNKIFDSHIILKWENSIISSRKIICLEFSPIHPCILLAAYETSKFETGVICLWNTNNTFAPQKVLTCDGSPNVICFNQGRAHLAFAGTLEGSIFAFDLRSSSRDISPSYITDLSSIHSNKIVGLQSLSETSSDKTFQLVSLDDSGKICIWTVTELPTNDLSDVLLAPNSTIKLILSSTILLDNYLKHVSICRSFEIPHNFNSEIFICCGNIVRKSRANESLDPSIYSSNQNSILLSYCSQRSFEDSKCISFHSILDGLFLAGYSNGRVCLFSVEGAEPIYSWTISSLDIIKVCWSHVKHSVFTVMSFDSIFTFDLLVDDSKPIHAYKFEQSDSLSSLSTSCLSSNLRLSLLALSSSIGSIDVYTFNDSLININSKQIDQLKLKLDR